MELPTTIKKQEEEGEGERQGESAKRRASRANIKLVMLAWPYLQRRRWAVDSPRLSQLPLKPWRKNRSEFGRRCSRSTPACLSEQPETNSACLPGLSVQLLPDSVNPPLSHNSPRGVVSEHSCPSHFKTSSHSDNTGKICQSVSERTGRGEKVP